jgi:hypothetical protein
MVCSLFAAFFLDCSGSAGPQEISQEWQGKSGKSEQSGQARENSCG